MDNMIKEINLLDSSPDEPTVCIVCGRELTAYGSKKLKDGMLCRYCSKKMSEWLDADFLAEMTAEEAAAHLEYREKNREELADFVPEYFTGGKYKLYVNAGNDLFLISKRKDFKAANADLLKLSAIKQIRFYTSAYEEENLGDVMMDMEMEDGEIRYLCLRVNEFPGLETDSGEFEKAKSDSRDMAELFKFSGIDEERIVFEYGE